MTKTKIESIEDLQIKIYMMKIEIDENKEKISKLVNRITEINKRLNTNKKTVLKF